MSDDEQCDAELVPGMRCHLPPHGDDIEHEALGELPEDLNILVAEYLDELDRVTAEVTARRDMLNEELKKFQRHNRNARVLTWVAAAAALLNVGILVTRMTGVWG